MQARAPAFVSWRAALLVLAVCAIVYWLRLGATPLRSSEGLRVLPAWEMLDRGDPLVPRLLGRIYLAKPPGMTWAVAASSAVLGRTEFAARAVSALACTLMALLAMLFAARWFGPRLAVVAGLLQALAPWFWESGRMAEIEPLHNLFVMVAVCSLIELLVRRSAWPWAIAAGIALGGAGLMKGPAGLPVLVGTLVALRAFRPALVGALLLGTAVFLGPTWLVWRAAALADEPVITQRVGVFLWRIGALWMAPLALVFSLPLGGLLLARAHDPVARALVRACLFSLAAFVLAGVANPRYAMPAFVFLAPLAACVRVRRAFVVGGLSALLAGAVLWAVVIEPRRDLPHARDAAAPLARALAGVDEIGVGWIGRWHPQLVHYVREALGRPLAVRWLDKAPPSGSVVLVRAGDIGDGFEILCTVELHGHEIQAARVR